METEREVYLDRTEVPKGIKVMVIRVKDPLILLVSSEEPDSDTAVYRHRVVYVELTDQEFAQAQGNQSEIDALARQLAPLVQRKLDAPWYRWVEEDGS